MHITTLLVLLSMIAGCTATASAAALTGSGTHLALPSGTGPVSPGIAPAVVAGGSSFTGTWSAPAGGGWLGTFSGTGPYPNSPAGASTTTWDFTTIGAGFLPGGTYFRFGDVDGGSENFVLRAYDSLGIQITSAWLDGAIFVSGSNPAEFVSNAMPGWSFSGGTYTIDGSTVSGLNPTITVTLPTNVDIYSLQVDKSATNFGFGLAAPVPEPGTLALFGAGLVGLGFVRRRKL